MELINSSRKKNPSPKHKMSSDIVKEAVLDSRIIQSQPKFAVDKGALSITNSPFNAIAATQSQHTYNIN